MMFRDKRLLLIAERFAPDLGGVARSAARTATVSARGNDIDMLMFPPGDFARLTWTLDRARVITAVSGDLSRKVRLLSGEARPVQVVPNNVDVEIFRPAPADEALRTSLGILPDEAVLGFSGELRQKKGLVPLLQLWAGRFFL